jgi:solute carrier family 25 (peroxisomal adenine nucleotide transporter), member 17
VFSGRKASWAGTRYDHLLILDPYNWFMCYLKGMGAQILKAVLSQGVLFMSKEQFEQYALAIIVLYHRLSASR